MFNHRIALSLFLLTVIASPVLAAEGDDNPGLGDGGPGPVQNEDRFDRFDDIGNGGPGNSNGAGNQNGNPGNGDPFGNSGNDNGGGLFPQPFPSEPAAPEPTFPSPIPSAPGSGAVFPQEPTPSPIYQPPVNTSPIPVNEPVFQPTPMPSNPTSNQPVFNPSPSQPNFPADSRPVIERTINSNPGIISSMPQQTQSTGSATVMSRYITGDFNNPSAFGTGDDLTPNNINQPMSAGAMGNGNGESSLVFVVSGPVVSINRANKLVVIRDKSSKQNKTIYMDEATVSRLHKGSVIQTTLRPGSSRAENVKQIV
jgi:hypothetical protein